MLRTGVFVSVFGVLFGFLGFPFPVRVIFRSSPADQRRQRGEYFAVDLAVFRRIDEVGRTPPRHPKAEPTDKFAGQMSGGRRFTVKRREPRMRSAWFVNR